MATKRAADASLRRTGHATTSRRRAPMHSASPWRWPALHRKRSTPEGEHSSFRARSILSPKAGYEGAGHRPAPVAKPSTGLGNQKTRNSDEGFKGVVRAVHPRSRSVSLSQRGRETMG